MKTQHMLLLVSLVFALTSMMFTETVQDTKPESVSKPVFQKSMITIKVKDGVGEFDKQRGNVTFNIPSLDAKANRFEVNLLEKRFHYNPEKLGNDLPDLSRIYRIEFPEKYSVARVAACFSEDPNVEYAEPIPVYYHCEVPNDPMYNQLQHLFQIDAESAWDIHKGEDGEEEVVIGIVDSGVDWDHEDLVDNIWQNLGEDVDGDRHTLEFIGGEWLFDPDDENGIDDDENGFVDDFIGWNFHLSGNDPDATGSHGTHCAGLAGGVTNNGKGIASISWNLKILAVNGSDPNLNGAIGYGYEGIIYAAENGADVISNSWGTTFYSQAGQDVIGYATGLGSIIVAAAGNDNQFMDHYPSDYKGVVSVAAVYESDIRAGFSNYGPNIWVSSPGVNVWSTMPNNNYSTGSGTSMATPIVAGLLGLVKSYHPDWTSDQVITQVLGTADDIDPLNPGFENQLGSGRINAFRALSETNVILDQEIGIDLDYSTCHDLDGNTMLEPGDTVNLSFKIRNYNYGVSADNVTFTLTTEDPDIIILDNTCTGNIPADDYFTLDHVFLFKISEETNIHLVDLKLITTADDVEITWGDTISFEVLVAPQGILVYQGEGTGSAYSGDFINDYLAEQGLQVFYTSHFPSSLNGFDAVFLSYGNYGITLRSGVIVTCEMVESIIEYLENGGNVYAESGSFFGIMAYLDYANIDEAMKLFGVEDVITPLSQNSIDMLFGINNSICEDLAFGSSTQNPIWYIDVMTPGENGQAAFEEFDYGTVAVQGEGEYGQKTFVFSYALAHLEDGEEPNTREELLRRICEFFDVLVSIDQLQVAGYKLQVFPNPCHGLTNIKYTSQITSHKSQVTNQVELTIFDLNGNKIQTLVDKKQSNDEHTIQFNASTLPAGIYLVRLQAGEEVVTKKLVVMR